MYYYNHYRNYVNRAEGMASAKNPMTRAWPVDIIGSNASRAMTGSNTVLLNKAQNSHVLDYARNLSTNIVNLKEAAKMYIFDMHLIDGGIASFESHLQWIEEDLQSFIDSYNNIQNITSRYEHSPELTNFAHYMRSFARQDSQILSNLGVITFNESSLTYHGLGETPSRETARQAVDAFKIAYGATREFLEHPLAHHMEFEGLNYYYNYTIGKTSESTFGLIGSGMLLDIAI